MLKPTGRRATRAPGRIGLLVGLVVLSSGPIANARDDDAYGFHTVEPSWLVSADEAHRWAKVKNDNLPTMTGSRNWQNFLTFLEQRLDDYGVVDVLRNGWQFERWHTTEDSVGWSLVSDGAGVRVASYGANSGSTGPGGITAEMVYYDHEDPPASIEGKIVVIPTRRPPTPPYDDDYLINFTYTDYELRTNAATFPRPLTYVPAQQSFTFDIWYQLRQRLEQIAREGGAAGAVIVYDMAYERTAGLYTFPVPELYDSPTLVLSREDGERVIVDAKAGKTATLRLEAETDTSTAYQLVGYLPGKDYGTPRDEQILLVTHTDGPSITQENGALGLLAIVKYYAHIPRRDRPRTLAIYLDCRHYMPGMERAYADRDWLTRYPQAAKPLVALIHAEHMGEMDYREVRGDVQPTGLTEHAYLWTRNNPLLIDAAVDAAQKHGWSRAEVSVPERAGIHGGPQQPWWGVGAIGMRDTGDYDCQVWHCLDLPGFGLGGFLGYYWTSSATMNRWSNVLFRSQAATMIELTGLLMTADLDAIQPAPRN